MYADTYADVLQLKTLQILEAEFGKDVSLNEMGFFRCFPSSIYSWSISHILEHEFCLGGLDSQGCKEKNVDLRNSEQLLRVVFSTF